MNDFQRAFAVILFPVTVLSVGLFLWTLCYQPPTEAVSIDVRFAPDHVNVSELWVYAGEATHLTRIFPYGVLFSNLSVNSVVCRGQSYISYDGRYAVLCEGEFKGISLLGVEYTLHDPYSCYEDMCYFEGKFFENIRAEPIEFRVTGANDFESLPGPLAEGSQGDFSAAYVFASLPSYYGGTEYQGEFYSSFQGIKEKYESETRLESQWGSNILLVVSFESFMAFLLFLMMGMEPDIRSSEHSWFPPYLRPPHELTCMFFPDIPRENVISATVIDLAQKEHLEVEGNKLKVLSKRAKDPFQNEVLQFLVQISRNGEIVLDREWLDARAEEIGRTKFRKLSGNLKVDCAPELLVEAHDKTGDYFVLLLQAAFIMLAVGMYALSPHYLINYRSSLVVLIIVNLFWMVLSLRLGYMTFSRYTHAAALEKAGWFAYRNFTRSKVNLEKESRLNWDYLLVFATLFGFEPHVLSVAERKRVHFRNVYNPRLAVGAFELISRVARW